jgi:hypothetical protein
MPRPKSVISADIQRLEGALYSGARSVSTDGVTTTFGSADELRKSIGELRAELAAVEGSSVPTGKPRVRGVNLESAW